MMTFSFYIKKMDNMESTIQRLLETVYAMLARTAELAGSGSARPRPRISDRCIARSANSLVLRIASYSLENPCTHTHVRWTLSHKLFILILLSLVSRLMESLSDVVVGDNFVFQGNSKQQRKRRHLQQSSADDNRKHGSIPSVPPTSSRSTAQQLCSWANSQ